MRKKIVIASVTLMAIMFVGTIAGFLNFAPKGNNINQEPLDPETFLNKLLSPSTVNASALGNEQANITKVEYSDYQCPFCAQFNKETKDSIIENFIDTGKAKFLYKDLIVNDGSDKASTLAAAASYCAAEQGMYWEY